MTFYPPRSRLGPVIPTWSPSHAPITLNGGGGAVRLAGRGGGVMADSCRSAYPTRTLNGPPPPINTVCTRTGSQWFSSLCLTLKHNGRRTAPGLNMWITTPLGWWILFWLFSRLNLLQVFKYSFALLYNVVCSVCNEHLNTGGGFFFSREVLVTKKEHPFISFLAVGKNVRPQHKLG